MGVGGAWASTEYGIAGEVTARVGGVATLLRSGRQSFRRTVFRRSKQGNL